LACATGACDQIGFDLVTFTVSGGEIGSVELNSTGSAFEYRIDPPDAAPLPGAIYLFGSVLGGAFWFGRRKRSGAGDIGAPLDMPTTLKPERLLPHTARYRRVGVA
jgi:hypothetical protein